MALHTFLRTALAVVAACAVTATAACSYTAPVVGGSGETEGCKIGMLPKTTADPNFQAIATGGKEAADELGYEFDFNGPTSMDTAGQIQYIEQWSRKQYCGITLSANDPNSLVPAVKAAMAKGVTVGTFDADVNSDDAIFLAPFTAQAMGETLADEIISLTSPQARIYILTSTMTAPNQSNWINVIKEVFAKKYPQAVIQTIQPGEADTQKSYNTAKSWLQANPDTSGVLALDGNALQGASQAIGSLDKIGQVKLTGIGVPSQNKTALEDGSANSFFLYNSPDVGYAAIQVLAHTIRGDIAPGSESVDAGRLGTLKFIDKSTVLLGPPQKFDKDNVDNFNF
ncbi:substrate-binding domain-containing protein [Rhodococcus koreensis]